MTIQSFEFGRHTVDSLNNTYPGTYSVSSDFLNQDGNVPASTETAGVSASQNSSYDRLEISEEGRNSEKDTGEVLNPGESDEKKPGRKSSPAECETCKKRKYMDGSDEMVSYKTPTHIDPSESASKVSAHENEHVSNAYQKAEKNNGKVLSVTVSMHTAVCPECGRTYVSGGETRSTIAYSKSGKKSNGEVLGANLDLTA